MSADRVITAVELRAALDWTALVDALVDGHRGEPPAVARAYLEHEGNGFLAWHGWAPGSVIVAKLCTIVPGNTQGPAVQALVAVFDAESGVPVAVLDGTELTYWKTAAVSAMAARFLARPAAATLLMVGAGGLAPYLIEAHRDVRPSIDRVLVWNRTPAAAAALAARCSDEAGAECVVEVAVDLAAACSEADVISCATATFEPLVAGDWLRPGVHLDLVGGFTPAMREADDAAVRRSTLFVDHAGTIDEAGDLVQPIASGVCGREAVVADLYDLATARHPGRRSDDELTFFKSAGGAHLDLFAARHALAALAQAR